MTAWIKIDPANFGKAKRTSISGVSVEVYSSPFDVPEAVRGFYNKTEQKFVIQFQYIGGKEPLKTNVPAENIQLTIGRHSKRLYGIEMLIDEKKLREKGTKVDTHLFLPTVDKVLDKLVQRAEAAHRTGNYKVAKEILSKRAKELSKVESYAA